MSFLVDPLLSVDDLLKDLLVDFGVISRQDLARGRLSQATRHDMRSSLNDFLKSLVFPTPSWQLPSISMANMM